MVKKLFVDINGVRVGTLELLRGELRLSYAQTWIDHPNRRSLSRSLPIQEVSHSGDVVANYFGNLLPDNPNSIKVLARSLRVNEKSIFDLLEQIGRDCIGAVQLYPENIQPPSPQQIQSKLLSSKEIEQLLQNLRQMPLGVSVEDDFRISLAGAQEKTALLKTDEGWALPLKATPTTHLFKIPFNSLSNNNVDFPDSCENEWLCLRLAHEFHLPVVQAEIQYFGSQKALIVERFDRKRVGNSILRLPTEDLCQALGVSSNLKYETDGGPGIKAIMALLKNSANRDLDCHNFMAIQVFLWLINSTDGHAKNYSIFIGSQDTIWLTPFYDILSVEPLIAAGKLPSKKAALAMGLIGKKRHYKTQEIQIRHFLSTANAVGYQKEEMLSMLEDFAQNAERVVTKIREELPTNFPKDTSEPIFDCLLKRAKKIQTFLALQEQDQSSSTTQNLQ